MTRSSDEAMFTRGEYLLLKIMDTDPTCNVFMAQEAIASTALAHPEWGDIDGERRTFAEWKKSND